jgi:hypothetical protein
VVTPGAAGRGSNRDVEPLIDQPEDIRVKTAG